MGGLLPVFGDPQCRQYYRQNCTRRASINRQQLATKGGGDGRKKAGNGSAQAQVDEGSDGSRKPAAGVASAHREPGDPARRQAAREGTGRRIRRAARARPRGAVGARAARSDRAHPQSRRRRLAARLSRRCSTSTTCARCSKACACASRRRTCRRKRWQDLVELFNAPMERYVEADDFESFLVGYEHFRQRVARRRRQPACCPSMLDSIYEKTQVMIRRI